jgi:hypothetical protein
VGVDALVLRLGLGGPGPARLMLPWRESVRERSDVGVVGRVAGRGDGPVQMISGVVRGALNGSAHVGVLYRPGGGACVR